MATGDDIFCGENSQLNVLAEEIFVGVSRHRPVRRQISTFGADHNLLALEIFCCKLLDGRADASFAALQSVIDGSVENVDAVFHRGDGRRCISLVSLCVRLPEVSAEPQGGEHQTVRFSEMTYRGASCELLRVARCSFFGGGLGHGAPSGG